MVVGRFALEKPNLGDNFRRDILDAADAKRMEMTKAILGKSHLKKNAEGTRIVLFGNEGQDREEKAAIHIIQTPTTKQEETTVTSKLASLSGLPSASLSVAERTLAWAISTNQTLNTTTDARQATSKLAWGRPNTDREPYDFSKIPRRWRKRSACGGPLWGALCCFPSLQESSQQSSCCKLDGAASTLLSDISTPERTATESKRITERAAAIQAYRQRWGKYHAQPRQVSLSRMEHAQRRADALRIARMLRPRLASKGST
jgi:hypothetical protein